MNWEAWSSIATTAAVVLAAVALWWESRRTSNSQKAEWRRADELSRIEQEERERERGHRAMRIGLVIDRELFEYGGKLAFIELSLSDEAIEADAHAALKNSIEMMPQAPMPLTARFLEVLDIFPPPLAANPTMVFGAHQALAEAPGVADLVVLTPAQMKEGATVQRHLISENLRHIRSARDKMQAVVAPIRPDNIDFRVGVEAASAAFDGAA